MKVDEEEFRKIKHAANCALWLLSQPELNSLINGAWGDPLAIKILLEEVGCKPTCKDTP